jgi:hypothetical protein
LTKSCIGIWQLTLCLISPGKEWYLIRDGVTCKQITDVFAISKSDL